MTNFQQQIIAYGVVLLVFLTMQLRRNAPTDFLFAAALAVFIACGITPMELAWSGFASEAVIAIGGLLVVAAALRNTGALDAFGQRLLGSVRTQRGALGRLSCVLLPSSAFLLNTAIVAMLLPVVITWCRRMHVSPSRLLLPISYMAILGGTCTLVGTSTNLVVNGELARLSQEAKRLQAPELATAPGGQQSEADLAKQKASVNSTQALGISASQRLDPVWLAKQTDAIAPMGLFEISKVGIPCAIGGVLLILLTFRRLLPERTELLESLGEQRREYLVEMTVSTGCTLVGRTVEEGGLRSLPGLFLIEIDRDGDVIGPVAPTDRIQLNDRLVFTGVVATIIDLEKIPGLIPAADINYEITPAKADSRSLVEVVLSPSSPLVGSTIRQANFRQLYGAAVVAVHRNGERLPTKIGDIELSPGDTLLLQTSHGFVRNFRNRPDFYLVSGVEDSGGRRHDKLVLSCAITALLIAWLLLQPCFPMIGLNGAVSSPQYAIFAAAIALVVFRCISPSDARRAIDLPMLVTIGAAVGVGKGFAACGAAKTAATAVIAMVGTNEWLALAALFIITVMLTEMISNVAVAVMMFHIAIFLASQLGDVSPRPFIMAVTIAASLSFISPIGYQTNLMVMGPGGYRPGDYIRAGLPLSILVTVIALVIIPLVWTF